MNFLFEDFDNWGNLISCEDVNPSGIKRFTRSPLLNAASIYHSFNRLDNFIQYKNSDENVGDDYYIISLGVNHSPEDWTGYNSNKKSLFSYISEKYLADIKIGKAFLLIDQSFEGYQSSWLWEWFHTECGLFEIPPKQVIYVTGNMIVDVFYNDWANDNNISERIKVVGYSHFELDMAMECYRKGETENPLHSFNDNLKHKIENVDKIKTYACLNRRLRNHRSWFYKYLYHSGLLEKGLVSMNKFGEYSHYFEGKEMSKLEVSIITKNLPLLVYDKRNDELDDNFYIRRFNDEVCLDTYMTVISEAQCNDSDNTMFLSEKTFKVIACRHPFIIMGNKDSMRMMREIGYKTFDGFIDEAYDNLPAHDRLQYIVESIRKVDNIKDKIEWYKSMEDVLEHNYNTLINKLYKIPKEFDDIRKYCQTIYKKLI